MNGLMYVDSGSPMIHDNRLFGPLSTTMTENYFGRFGKEDVGSEIRNLVLSSWLQGNVVFKLRELDMRKNVLFMDGIYFVTLISNAVFNKFPKFFCLFFRL